MSEEAKGYTFDCKYSRDNFEEDYINFCKFMEQYRRQTEDSVRHIKFLKNSKLIKGWDKAIKILQLEFKKNKRIYDEYRTRFRKRPKTQDTKVLCQ